MTGNADSPHYYARESASAGSMWRMAWAQYFPTGWQIFTVKDGERPRLLGTTVSRRKARRMVDSLMDCAPEQYILPPFPPGDIRNEGFIGGFYIKKEG